MMQMGLSKRIHCRAGGWQWSAPLWALLLAVLGVALFCRLGVWQLDRAAQKAAMTARYEARRHMAPLELPALLAFRGDVADLRLHLRGHYDNTRTVYLDNQRHGGRAGFHVYTLFMPEGERRGILVNRGWVEAGADMQRLPPVPPATAGQLQGSVALPSPYFTVGEPDYRLRPLRVARLEMRQLSLALGVELRPFVVRLDSDQPNGFVRDWTPGARLGMPPEQHRAYAFQWFCLAAAVLVLLVVINLHRGEKSAHE